MRNAFGIDKPVQELTSRVLIKACLRAPVDLLWNGGVGTFVKAVTETNDVVGDKTNDELRVDGCELRAKRGRGRESGPDPARPGRVRRAGRPHQHRLHRQLCRGRHSDHEVNIKVC